MIGSIRDLLMLNTYWTFSICFSRFSFHYLQLCFLFCTNACVLYQGLLGGITWSGRTVQVGRLILTSSSMPPGGPPRHTKSVTLLILAPGFWYYTFHYPFRASRVLNSLGKPFLTLEDFPTPNTVRWNKSLWEDVGEGGSQLILKLSCQVWEEQLIKTTYHSRERDLSL